MKSMATALTLYTDDNDGLFPYGVDTYQLTNNQFSPSALSPQELLFQYLDDPMKIYICPTDPTPENYVWWRFRGHPNGVDASSYMFCENGLYGNVYSWRGGKPLGVDDIDTPSEYVYMSDGRYAPNGWGWWTLDPAKFNENAPWRVRIDWDHRENVNMLYGDFHVGEKWRFDNISFMRNRADVNQLPTGTPY